MGSTQEDVLDGISASVAVKAPCAVVFTTNVTQSGLHGYTEGTRALCVGQSNAVNNGIFAISSGTWTRTKDADGSRDLRRGTRVLVRSDSTIGIEYELTTADPVVPGTSSLVFALRYGANATFDQDWAEAAAGVVPFDEGRMPGDSRRQGITNDSATDHTTAFQALLNGAAGAVPVHIYKTQASGYIRLTGRITAPANTRIVLHDGVELRWTATTATGSTFLDTATRPGIEVTGDNFRIEGHGMLRGPSVATYVSNEAAIYMKGTSTGSRKSKITIADGVEICDWGSYGVLAQFVSKIEMKGWLTHIHSCGRAGWSFASCDAVRVTGIQVGNITPGVLSECYGGSFTHDSRNYHLDPNAGTKAATHPFCWDVIVTLCTFYDIPTWRGLDAHGGYETHFHKNDFFNCGLPIGLSSSSGDAINYAGANNSITENTMTSKKRDGSATTVTTAARGAIIANGGATVRHQNITVRGNVIDGYGTTANDWHNIDITYCLGVVCEANELYNWYGNGIYSTGSTGVIARNIFGAVASATNSRCVRLDATDSGSMDVLDNPHKPLTGTFASEGLRIGSGHPRCTVRGNSFESATTPYSGDAATLTKGMSDLVPRMQVSGTPTSIDVGPLERVDVAWIEYSGNVTTVTNLTNAKAGCRYILHNAGANNLTFDRTNAALAAGASAVLGQHDTLLLQCIAETAAPSTRFIAIAGPLANS